MADSYAGWEITQRFTFGCEPLGGVDWGGVDTEEVKRAISFAWDLGVRSFDTADVYGLGASEVRLARALGSRRRDAHIITKVGCRWTNQSSSSSGRAAVWKDSSPRYVTSAVEASLRRLEIDAIPLCLIHWPDINTPLAETLECMEALKEEGKILAYGLSNHRWADVNDNLKSSSIAAIQNEFSLMACDSEEKGLLVAKRSGVDTFVYGALAQGLLSGKYTSGSVFDSDDRRHRLPNFELAKWRRNDALLQILRKAATAHEQDMSQVALRWILDHNEISSVVVGIKSMKQLENNLGAFNWRLDEEWFERLSSAARAFSNAQ